MKKILLVFSLISICFLAMSQSYRYRHARDMRALDFNLGKTKNGLSVELGAIEFLSSNMQHVANLNTEFGKVGTGTTDYFKICGDYSRQYTVYDLKKNFFLNLFAGASIGGEFIKNKSLNKTKKKLVPGIIAGFEIESYINNNIVALIKFQENYRFKSKLGEFSYKIQLGCRYFF